MANRYWVGGNANWDATAGSKWSTTSGGGGGSAVPTTSDDVFLDNGTGTGNVTISATANAKSLTCTSYTGIITWNAVLNVVNSVTFVSGQVTMAGTGGNLNITSTSTLTSGGKTLPCALTIAGSAITYTLGDDWTVNGTLTTGGGAQVVNGNNFYLKGSLTIAQNNNVSGTTIFNLIGTGTWGSATTGNCLLKNSLVINTAGTITLGTTGTIQYNTGTLTYTAGTVVTTGSTLTINASTTLNTAGIVFNNITCNATQTLTNNSLLTATGTLTKSAAITWAGSAGFTVANFTDTTAGLTHTYVAGLTYTVTTAFTATGTAASHKAFISSTPTSPYYFILSPGCTTDIEYLNVTDADSSDGRPIWAFKPTLTRTKNWNSLVAWGTYAFS